MKRPDQQDMLWRFARLPERDRQAVLAHFDHGERAALMRALAPPAPRRNKAPACSRELARELDRMLAVANSLAPSARDSISRLRAGESLQPHPLHDA